MTDDKHTEEARAILNVPEYVPQTATLVVTTGVNVSELATALRNAAASARAEAFEECVRIASDVNNEWREQWQKSPRRTAAQHKMNGAADVWERIRAARGKTK
jgi:hypothetical protein